MEQSERFDIEKAYKHANEVLDADRIDPETLKGCDQQMVARDMQYVRDREAQFKIKSTPEIQENKKVATVLEAIIHEQVELNDLLGPNTETITASRFDDIANGVDTIVRFGDNDAHLGLAVDVTFNTDIRDKLNAIMQNIERGKLTEIKYSATPDPENPDEHVYTGSLKIPRVVIGVEKEIAQQLGALWMNKKKKGLADHPAQHVIVKEILDQLAVYDHYAISCGNPNGIDMVYRRLSTVIERNLKEKKWKRLYRRHEVAQG